MGKKVSLAVPGGGTLEWEPLEAEESAAWEIYVELTTRVVAYPVDPDHAIARQALDSAHAIFAEIRSILRKYGPDVGRGNTAEFAFVLLNGPLRSFMTRWNGALREWEDQKHTGTPYRTHELAWTERAQFFDELTALTAEVDLFRDQLSDIAGLK